MNRLLRIIALLAFGAPAMTHAQEPFARASLSPNEPVVVGQPVTLTVEVFVPSFFQGAPVFPRLDPNNAITIFNDRGANLSRRIDGSTWAGQSRSYTVYPQRAGVYEISDIAVEVRYRGTDGGATSSPIAPSVRFEARIPLEAAGLGYFIAGSRVTLEESFDLRPDTIRIGDAFTRTLTASVFGALSIVIPPLELDSIPGIAIYAGQPRVDDTSGERGAQIVGTRIESTTYVTQAEGDFVVPAVELAWWDVDTEQLRRESVAGARFVVVANPDLATEFELPPDSLMAEGSTDGDFARFSLRDFIVEWGPTLLAGAILLTIAMRLLRRLEPGLRRRVGAYREAHAQSEATYFRGFREATRSGDPRQTANALMAWLDRWDTTPGPTTFGTFAEGAQDQALDHQADALDRTLYGRNRAGGSGGSHGWSASAFYNAVAKARRSSRRTQAERGLTDGLSPLNPSHGKSTM